MASRKVGQRGKKEEINKFICGETGSLGQQAHTLKTDKKEKYRFSTGEELEDTSIEVQRKIRSLQNQHLL